MANRNDPFFSRLTKLFRSGPAIQRRVKGYDYKSYYDNQLVRGNLGYRGPFPFGRESSPFSVLGAYGILDRMARYSEFAEMEYQPEIAAALNIFADETAAGDEKGKAFHLFSKNPEVKKALEELFYDILNIDFNLRPWIRNLVKYGDFFLYNEVIPDIGIVNVQPIPVNELEREEGFDQYDPYAVRYKWLTRGNRYLENWQITHMRVLGNDLFLPYGTCHEKTTKILTEDGLKEIQHIKVGDRVVSFDLQSQQKVVSPVLGVKNSGFKPCFEIRTKHNFLRTSKEHQILIWDASKDSFDYKSAGDLRVGDMLIINTTHSAKETNVSIDRSRPNEKNKNGYWNSSRYIPENVTPEFARLFGFLLGDGWISGNQVCFANGVDDKQNIFYASLLEKFTGKKPNTSINQGSQTVASSKMLTIILQRMGFAGKATTKRIPSWVYATSAECRKAFLQGMHDADGSSYVDNWKCERHCFELSNYELIKDLKTLAQTLGYKTGKITKRKSRNVKGRIVENGILREFKQISPSYMFYWFESQNKQIKKWSSPSKKSDYYITEPIVAIESVGSHETYDIYVQDSNHNFYANGIVTHNSLLEPARRIWRQLMMMEDSMLVYRVVRSPERRVFYIDVGNVAPNDVPSYMEAVKQTMRSRDVVDRTNGRMDQRYNPLSIDEDYFIPVRGGQTGTKIETLAGGQNATAVDDIKYLQQKLFAAIQVPKPYLNFDENLSAKASLAQQDVRFSRTISVLQRVILSELNKMAMIHLYSKGFDGEDLIAFELKLSNPSTVAMQQKLEAMNTKFDIAGKAKETKLVDQDWIQKKLLDLTDDDIIKIEAGIRRDKIREVEIEAIAIKENLPEKNTTTGPFDPSNYVMAGADVKKNPPLGEPVGGNANTPIQPKNISNDMQAVATSGVSIAGQPSASPDAESSGLPIKATPFLSAAQHNKRRRVGMGGRNNLAMPDFKDMLSGTNKNLTDINDKETLNLKSQFTTISEDIDLDYKPPPVISRDIKNLMNKLDIYFEKNGGRRNKKILTEADVNLSNLSEENIFEMETVDDEIVINSYNQSENKDILKEEQEEENQNNDFDLSILE